MVDRLAPGFLVAAPALRDPSFVRTVVALVEHGPEGSLGFVVNRAAPVSFAQVAELLSLGAAGGADGVPVFVGGPVAPQAGWILFDPEGVEAGLRSQAVNVSHRLAVSASRDLLAAIARERGPSRCLLALGYAGWGKGQLDAELAAGAWIPVDLDDEVVFDTAPEDRWSAALARAGIDPARMTSGTFSA